MHLQANDAACVKMLTRIRYSKFDISQRCQRCCMRATRSSFRFLSSKETWGAARCNEVAAPRVSCKCYGESAIGASAQIQSAAFVGGHGVYHGPGCSTVL